MPARTLVTKGMIPFGSGTTYGTGEPIGGIIPDAELSGGLMNGNGGLEGIINGNGGITGIINGNGDLSGQIEDDDE